MNHVPKWMEKNPPMVPSYRTYCRWVELVNLGRLYRLNWVGGFRFKPSKNKIYGVLVLHFHQSSRRFFRTSNPTLEFPSWGVESHPPLHFHSPPAPPCLYPLSRAPQWGCRTSKALPESCAINKRMFRIFVLNSVGHVINTAAPCLAPPRLPFTIFALCFFLYSIHCF